MKYLLVFITSLILGITIPLHAEDSKCSKLSLNECRAMKGCTLECETHDPKKCAPYLCRASIGVCENIIEQENLTKEHCESVRDCIYEAAFCFCPGPMECFCGGGPPARCISKKNL